MTSLEITYWDGHHRVTFTTVLYKEGYTLDINSFTGVHIIEKEGEK